MKKIPIKTKLTHSSKIKDHVIFYQKIIQGSDSVLDRDVTLEIKDEEVIELAIRILRDLVPHFKLKSVEFPLQLLAKYAERDL